MTNVDARSGIEIIGRDECLGLLRADVIGRVGVVQAGAPVVLPVNYAMDGDDVVFRTAPGTKLDTGPSSRGCFEIDSFDRATRTGWSVMVAGRLEEVQPHDVPRVTQLDVHPWAAGTRDHWMRLRSTRITGRIVRDS
jgi:nitroimidazol reductase NimA-like FMN-containing flavoprotein (pyridoxamine 5'-phosphate oxidase superfamily)